MEMEKRKIDEVLTKYKQKKLGKCIKKVYSGQVTVIELTTLEHRLEFYKKIF